MSPPAGGASALVLAALICIVAINSVDAGVVAVGKLQTCVNDGTVSVVRAPGSRLGLDIEIPLADSHDEPQLLPKDSGDRGAGEQQALRD